MKPTSLKEIRAARWSNCSMLPTANSQKASYRARPPTGVEAAPSYCTDSDALLACRGAPRRKCAAIVPGQCEPRRKPARIGPVRKTNNR